MFSRTNVTTFEDYFLPYSERTTHGVYFCRIASYSEKIQKDICQYIELTRTAGVCISRKIKNPDERQLEYYEEMMGREFALNPNFLMDALSKWIPRVREEQRKDIAYGFYDCFNEMAKMGKNESVQRNTYIKFMCWLYYIFEPVLQMLGRDKLPKILFEGTLTTYELYMLRILSGAGCDILVLEIEGDEGYKKLDPISNYSELFPLEGTAFPPEYSVIEIYKQSGKTKLHRQQKIVPTEKRINTNTWLMGDPLEDVLKVQDARGNDPECHYNLFAAVEGTEDPSSYYMELVKWKMKLDGTGRKSLLLQNGIPVPTYEETNAIMRRQYSDADALFGDMVKQIHASDKKAEAYCQNAFLQCMQVKKDEPLQRLMNTAVMMVCWMNRYAKVFFSNEAKEPLLVYYGQVKSEKEVLLLSMLAKTPMDVLILNPEGEEQHPMTDSLFFNKSYSKKVRKQEFPTSTNGIQFRTVAYEAEQELNTILYQDTGMYRNQQFQKAVPVTLQITYEEIAVLWKEEAKYRPNFETFTDRVMIPVIFAKVSGVKDSVERYWESVSELIDKNTYVIRHFPFLGNERNPYKEKTYLYLIGDKLNIRKIKNSPEYPFGILRENMQDMMLEKVQQLIDSRLIAGTLVNGMEHLIVATILNMDRQLLRLIQNYDFTKSVPKVVVIHTEDTICSPEDSILLAYLNLIGFDIVLYVPTGYNSIERYYTRQVFVEHQIGEYKYDMHVPNLDAIRRRKEGFASKIFRRGR